jgi:hypothetical protein
MIFEAFFKRTRFLCSLDQLLQEHSLDILNLDLGNFMVTHIKAFKFICFNRV